MAEPTERWSLPTRIAFRFFCAFFLLYFPIPMLPIQFLGSVFQTFYTATVSPVGQLVFGVEAKQRTTGSGDTTWDWVQLFVIVVLSSVITLVWSILDRKRTSYPRLLVWSRVFVRFALAAAMIEYGLAKALPTQFVPPSLDRLMMPFGQASPMGLLWTFMGWSPAYTVFAGIGELLGGLLLTTRRTALLGALITAGVMVNVAMMNFSYDVPVKLYSS
ncbi:MAG TPA: hypothetical protein VGQ76_01020, partial [Thermoanaerobaculia bacterium]|nr:hypothetical protein [Thermoanaerobaculia bacterium]